MFGGLLIIDEVELSWALVTVVQLAVLMVLLLVTAIAMLCCLSQRRFDKAVRR